MLTKFSITAYIYLALLAVIAALSFYCHVLNGEKDQLISDKATVVAINKVQSNDLQICSDSTQALKDAQTKITEDAKAAIAKAKVDADNDRKSANAILFRKPKTPTVTKDNVAQYGGSDPVAQVNDYLQTQDLINDYIDSRKAAK